MSTALTIYPCQIRVHQRRQSKLPTSYSSEEGVVAGHSGQFTPGGYLSTCDTHYFSRPRTHNLPLVRRATSSATDSPKASFGECEPIYKILYQNILQETTAMYCVLQKDSPLTCGALLHYLGELLADSASRTLIRHCYTYSINACTQPNCLQRTQPTWNWSLKSGRSGGH